ncbi:2-hydroxy-6-oxononadienedioate/2-hydroxy-6-oxononatrienedioate hydrolase [Hibiscus syriacus]|uniref:2-hydroxy-6-oxononadienedioate/2-hydroxy-6- oxononatrienedioate hydrolase n=1 Tax=Hibiscus syriacus TaxID=106335 RepID=UPI0019249F1B|nr:2-hydroxy-6-oxononadienedioate/2-hydroxy-6-oxononatrienedioate hydrolase [Hibiscus syriacus]
MTRCFSLTTARNQRYRSSFIKAGLRSTTTDLQDGTVMHCWVPKTLEDSKPNLLLIHGLGANAMWQWGDIVRKFIPSFNIFIPDLIFFGDSYTTRPERSDAFQAQCVMRVMEANSVRKLSLVGLSYGGFVGYSLAAQFSEAVERVVICCAGVCMEEKDLKEGVFRVSDLEEAARILVPQTPEKLKELLGFSLFKPPPLSLVPSCLLADFIDVMCTEHIEEKKELIRAIPKDRKFSNIPKINKPTLILWGEHDQIFPLELGHRFKRHLGDNAHLVVIKDAGHAFKFEKPKESYRYLKTFLADLQDLQAPPSTPCPIPNHENRISSCNGAEKIQP